MEIIFDINEEELPIFLAEVDEHLQASRSNGVIFFGGPRMKGREKNLLRRPLPSPDPRRAR